MPLLEWKDEFSVGVPSVDYEHRELIRLINELHASLSNPRSEMGVVDFLGELHARISAHFALEEKIMREREYDQYQDHKDDHERLLEEIHDLMDLAEDPQGFSEAVLATRLRDWFVQHFKTRDARLHKMLG